MKSTMLRISLSLTVITVSASDASAQFDQWRVVPGTIEAEDFSSGISASRFSIVTPGNSVGSTVRPTSTSKSARKAGSISGGSTRASGCDTTSLFRKLVCTHCISDSVRRSWRHVPHRSQWFKPTGPITIPDTGGWQSWTT